MVQFLVIVPSTLKSNVTIIITIIITIKIISSAIIGIVIIIKIAQCHMMQGYIDLTIRTEEQNRCHQVIDKNLERV